MSRRLAPWSLLVVVALLVAACTSGDSATPASGTDGAPTSDRGTEAGDGGLALAAKPGNRTYRIVTLGDAYTYGAGPETPGRDSWPAQMALSLNHRGERRVRVFNLAERSSPSVEVIYSQLAEVGGYEPDVVTLQVGVDDIVGSETDAYAENVALILDELRRILPPERIFVITTPDHTLTEWGGAYGSHDVVAALNDDLARVAGARDITVIDIGPVNERVALDDSLLVDVDPPRPYPTAKQYAGWAELIGTYINDALETVQP